MAELSGKKAMIIDDSEYLREKLRVILEEKGIEIVGEADNGITAIEKYKTLKPDFATLDIIMPKMQGIEVLQKLKEIDPDAVIIMISSVGSEDKILEAVGLGAKNFVLKPFEKEVVIDVVEKALN